MALGWNEILTSLWVSQTLKISESEYDIRKIFGVRVGYNIRKIFGVGLESELNLSE